jgi:hypothetical protein
MDHIPSVRSSRLPAFVFQPIPRPSESNPIADNRLRDVPKMANEIPHRIGGGWLHQSSIA